MAEKIKIGVVGTGRGWTFMRPSEATGLKLTAICDRREIKLQRTLEKLGNPTDVETYTDYDEMLEKADIDAVVLANYFHEHAPFAIKALPFAALWKKPERSICWLKTIPSPSFAWK